MYRLLSSLCFCFLFCRAVAFGPAVKASKGEVWPKPQQQDTTPHYFVIRPDSFSFQRQSNIGCPNFIDDALKRYWNILDNTASSKKVSWDFEDDENFLGYLETVTIFFTEKCESDYVVPALGDGEYYSLSYSIPEGFLLEANTIWGVLRGLETFSQLVYVQQDFLLINGTFITDFPRFPHRGLLIDTSRHFEPLSVIFQMLDAMAYNKLNVFHWHLTDDQSFPYRSRTFPELSDKGAYHPIKTTYSQSDISAVIEYARLRGIRVVPEFDTPGHTASWGESHPELLTTCYTDNAPNGQLGPMDPTKNTTYEFINQLFTEIVDVFPDSYFHIGGDEVDFSCWQSNPDVTAFMTEQSITTYEQLENYFIQNVVDLLDSLQSQYLVWEEVFVNGVDLPNSTVVHVWKDNGLSTLLKVVQAGKRALYSSCWYLSVVRSGSNWDTFYKCEPLVLIHETEQRNLVIGGEACMWGEYVNEYSIIQRVWPRASAVAERLWSAEEVTDIEDAKVRLEEHACRMNKRGIAAQPPNGPGVCL